MTICLLKRCSAVLLNSSLELFKRAAQSFNTQVPYQFIPFLRRKFDLDILHKDTHMFTIIASNLVREKLTVNEHMVIVRIFARFFLGVAG